MKKIDVFFLILLSIFQFSCNEKNNDETHFITDENYRKEVIADFEKVKILAKERENELFGVFENELTLAETEALQFLFAYMPLSDLADYDGDYYLGIVKTAFRAKNEMSWGKDIPEDIFRHFVLPHRVNNENLDTFRVSMYEELAQRVKNLSIADAALEINHWCHEHVVYKGTDGRTSAPLSTMRTAYGRCGEESTFTVTALRTVGIPARQVYTPRWAHTDDNHAWVEIWADGKWFYLGACEPEPMLNVAWFNEPVKRAMLVHTKAFGKYMGNEEVITESEKFSELNLISNYAPTAHFFVKVVDNENNIVQNAIVEFQLYNYAEFYPIATKTTDNKGITDITTGLGDLLIYASKNDVEMIGYQKITAGEKDTIVIALNKQLSENQTLQYDIVPPIFRSVEAVSENLVLENKKRLSIEDSIRNCYTTTFPDSIFISNKLKEMNFLPEKFSIFVEKSEGNYTEIFNFLEQTPQSNRELAYNLLQNISEKDLRDTPAKILLEHLNNSILKDIDNEIFAKYVLSPRIDNELLSEYKSFFQNNFDEVFKNEAFNNPQKIVNWIVENITINDDLNFYRAPLSPVGCFKLKVSNIQSRNILFVAICRSLGIPARLHEASRVPQYFAENIWHDAVFEELTANTPSGRATISLRTENEIIPKYFSNFTLARFQNGRYQTLEYEEGKPLNQFPEKMEVYAGNYLLVTGTRQSDGTVLSELKYFTIVENSHTEILVNLRENASKQTVYGKINSNILSQTLRDANILLNNNLLQNGCVIGWLSVLEEPSRHILHDFSTVKNQFENWNGKIIFMIDDENSFKLSDYPNLPSNCQFVTDSNNSLFKEVTSICKESVSSQKPFLILLNKNFEIVYYSKGYRIGTGELLLKEISKLE